MSHRLPIALEAQNQNFHVTVCAIEEAGLGEEIRQLGLDFVPLPATRSGMNVFRELRVVFFLFRLYKKLKPHVVHHVAMKPVTYGSIAARLAKVPLVVNALSGLGFLYVNKDSNKSTHVILKQLFKFGFVNPNVRMILQNRDDLILVQELGVLTKKQLYLIKGSGVDLEEFKYSEIRRHGKLRVLLPARMLWDKGVGEFHDAASLLRAKGLKNVEFLLAGGVDLNNKACISKDQLNSWNEQGNVSWLGFQRDMITILEDSHIVVLPSYREGLPKALIEACAIGRPIVATNVPGCRDVVEDGCNGYLVPVKNSEALALAIEKLLKNESLRSTMGRNSRRIAEENFSIDKVITLTLAIYLEDESRNCKNRYSLNG